MSNRGDSSSGDSLAATTSGKNPLRGLFRAVFWALSALFPSLVTAKTWDREYAQGDWDCLYSDEQLGHYMIIVGYVLRVRKTARILEVGCGSGRLLELLGRVGFEHYLGVDLSEEAIAQARALEVPHSAFQVADACSFSTQERFDVIIFNEVVYYLKNPAEVLLHYAGLLREDGAIVVSMFDFVPSRRIWPQIDQTFETLDTNRVENRKGQKWEIRLISKRPG